MNVFQLFANLNIIIILSMFALKLIKGILISTVVFFLIFQMRFMPSHESNLHYKGYNVTIKRDNKFNIPHINGQSKLAAFYAFGYAMSEDRLFQIHMKRMIGKGRLAEIVGEKGINLDIFFREMGVGYMSKLSANRMKEQDPISFQGYQAYADGINDYVKNSGLGLQFYLLWTGFQEWQVQDIFVITKLVDWIQSADAGLTVARELLAQKMGREQAEKILGSKQQDFLLVNESTIVSDEELEWSKQYRKQSGEKKALTKKSQDNEDGLRNNISLNSNDKLKGNVQEVNVEEINNNIEIKKNIQNKGEKKQIVSETQSNLTTKESEDLQKQYLENTQSQLQEKQVKIEEQEKTQEQTHVRDQNQTLKSQIANISAGSLQFNKSLHNQNNTFQKTSEKVKQSLQPLLIAPTQKQQLPSKQQLQQQLADTKREIQNVTESENIDPSLLHLIDGGAGASNSWVISGEHTASGKPILANDPHMAVTIPSDWYQAQIRYPFKGREALLKGAFIAGTAVTDSIGKTNYFAWGCTMEYKDTQDLYREKVEGNKYIVDGEWRNLVQRQERIRVRNGDDKIITVSETHRGPLLSKIIFLEKMLQIPGNVSFAWTGINTDYQFLAFMLTVAELNDYQSTKAIFRSLDYGPAMNTIFITKDNHFGYQTLGRIPRRKGKQSPFFFNGTTSQNDWDGYITGQDKLYLNDPPKGYIITANSRPASSNFKENYYETNFLVTSRQYRISKLLQQKINSGKKLTIKDSMDIQLDNVDEYCMIVLPYLKQIDPRFKRLFSEWSCQFQIKSYQASIYEAFLLKLQFKLQPYKDIPLYGFSHFNHYTYKYIMSAANSSNPSTIGLITQSLTEGLSLLKDKFKTEAYQKWQWGQLHLTHYPHLPFSNSPFKYIFDRYHPSGGNLNTPNMGKMVKLSQQIFNCEHHAAIRMILTFVEGQSQWVMDTGISSYPFSNYYDDQELMHKQGKYINFERGDEDRVNIQL